MTDCSVCGNSIDMARKNEFVIIQLPTFIAYAHTECHFNILADKRTQSIGPIIAERAKTHGDFGEVSIAAQDIKKSIRIHRKASGFEASQMEILEMIALKIARTIAGNPNEIDHRLDIEGYARLVRERLELDK